MLALGEREGPAERLGSSAVSGKETACHSRVVVTAARSICRQKGLLLSFVPADKSPIIAMSPPVRTETD
jgi:hypothetical protein